MRFTRPILLLSTLAVAIGGCSDAPTASRATPAAPAHSLSPPCTGQISSVVLVGPSSIDERASQYQTIYMAEVEDPEHCGVDLSTHTVTWTSSNPFVGTIVSTQPGGYSIHVAWYSAGTTVLTLKVDQYVRQMTVTVRTPPTLSQLVVTPATATVAAGGSVTFTARGVDQYGNDYPLSMLGWGTSNSSIATISSSGVATAANARGTVTVDAYSGILVAHATLNVVPGITLSAPQYVYEGPYTVSAGVQPGGTYYYVWSESVCSTVDPCTDYEVVAQGTNLTSVERSMSRYDNYRAIKLEIRDSATGPALNSVTTLVGGPGEQESGGNSCFPQLVCS
ncbi:Ig-like domain-containing protein [Longimicrobium sp.]|uniref:Ig-like domain-containing protein n=1 Tax=Longimicrobium sp. TaxID=2029185 RepID=UPI002C22810D|nr:Ig-like domain-containing protein [Longimicrobium sp.]HSU12588.1 Ig-like domain-containing protein [Longimicrobium sp.]